MTRRSLASVLAMLLASCAGAPGEGGYPSLAKRPIEGRQDDQPAVETAAPTTPVPADPALTAQIRKLEDQARSSDAAFRADLPNAERQVRAGNGAGVSSDAWVSAQLAISALEGKRNDSVSALASLDTLYVSRLSDEADGKVQGGSEAIAAARATTLAIVDAQNDALDRLKATLRTP